MGPTLLDFLNYYQQKIRPNHQRRSPNIFRPYDLSDTPPATNSNTVSNIESIIQKMQELVLQAHSKVGKQTSGCVVCGKSYEQVIESTTADYLQQMAKARETIRKRQLKRQAFSAGLQSLFIHSTGSVRGCRLRRHKIATLAEVKPKEFFYPLIQD